MGPKLGKLTCYHKRSPADSVGSRHGGEHEVAVQQGQNDLHDIRQGSFACSNTCLNIPKIQKPGYSFKNLCLELLPTLKEVLVDEGRV